MADPLTLRYNNPGAVEFKPWMSQYGARLGPNGRYAQFDSPDQGYQVMGRVLDTYRDKHGLNTVNGIINRWAPANVDNNSTGTYAANVAKSLGIDPSAPLTPEQRPSLMRAMASYEAGRPVPGMTSQPMALGNQPAPAPAAPPPTGAPPMADPYQKPQPRGGFLGLLDGLQSGVSSPLFQSGAAMYSAASQGKDIGTGFLMGGEAAGRASQQQMQQTKMRREMDIEQRQQQMWDDMTGGKVPPWATGLPQGTLELARALGPVAGPKLVSEMVVKQASANQYGKQGTIVQGGDGKFYSVQFSERGERKIEPLEIGGAPTAPGVAQPGAAGQAVPPVPGAQPQGPVSLSPSRGVSAVGSQLINNATGQPVRDVGASLADKQAQEEIGAARGKAQVNLPNVESLAKRITKQIEGVENDPNLPNITGWRAKLPTLIPENITTEEKTKQLSGAAFLQAFESLKGAGAITEVEGEKATSSLARLSNLKQDTEGYRQALKEFKAEVQNLVALARRKASGGPSAVGSKPEDKVQNKSDIEDRKQLPDGRWAVKRNGQWFEE